MPHIHEKIDFTVAVFIVFNDTVLLVHHKALKMWLPVGGHIEMDEDPEEALVREIQEESGLEDVEIVGFRPPLESSAERKILTTPAFMDLHRITDTHSHVGMGYLAKAKSNEVVLAEREHNAIKWFTRDMLSLREFKIDPGIQWYAREALRRISW